MNTIDELRTSLHDAVDHEPTSTVDAATIVSGALGRHRRRMAIGTTAVSGVAVLAMSASAQSAVTVNAASSGTSARVTQPALAISAIPRLEIQPPAVAVPGDGDATAFTTERGERITVTNRSTDKADVLGGLGLVITDGSDPTKGIELGAKGWGTAERLNPERPVLEKNSVPVAAKVARVRTSHGVLLVMLASENVDAFLLRYLKVGVRYGDLPQLPPVKGKQIIGARKATVLWSYLPDMNTTEVAVVVGHRTHPSTPAMRGLLVSLLDLGKMVELTRLAETTTPPSADPSPTPSAKPSVDPSPTPSATPSVGQFDSTG